MPDLCTRGGVLPPVLRTTHGVREGEQGREYGSTGVREGGRVLAVAVFLAAETVATQVETVATTT